MAEKIWRHLGSEVLVHKIAKKKVFQFDNLFLVVRYLKHVDFQQNDEDTWGQNVTIKGNKELL